jgi:hypothetical protein
MSSSSPENLTQPRFGRHGPRSKKGIFKSAVLLCQLIDVRRLQYLPHEEGEM